MRPSLPPCSALALASLVASLATACTTIVAPDLDRLADPERDGGPGDLDAAACDLDCDDGIACTVDRCVGGACVHTADDGACGGPGDACVGTATCDPPRSSSPSGCVYGAPIVCDDGLPCTDDQCDPERRTCRFVPNHDACDDAIDCTRDTCDPARREGDGCVHTPDDSVCDAGFCHTGGRCDGARGCTGGTPRSCSDGLRCTDDRCSEELAACIGVAVDADGDGFAAQRVGGEACIDGTDCDDTRASVNPGATEVCGNGIDDDCDGVIDGGCATCRPMPSVCPTGWSYTNDGDHHVCAISFTPPFGVREYCLYARDGILGFYWMLAVPYTCPSGARYAPNATTGYCLWERVAIPTGATVDCSAVGSGRMSFRWPC